MSQNPTTPHVLVTGASRGIGAEVARHFIAAGARVSLLARMSEELLALSDELGPNAEAFPADLRDPAAVARAMEQFEARFGPVDVLVNNAALGSYALLEDTAEDSIADQIAVNLEAGVRLVRLLLPGMKARRRGTLIHVASNLAYRPLAQTPVYAATKAAMVTFSNALNQDLRHHGVRSMVLSPGKVNTTFGGRALLPQEDSTALRATDVARLVVYLAYLPPDVLVSETTMLPLGGEF